MFFYYKQLGYPTDDVAWRVPEDVDAQLITLWKKPTRAKRTKEPTGATRKSRRLEDMAPDNTHLGIEISRLGVAKQQIRNLENQLRYCEQALDKEKQSSMVLNQNNIIYRQNMEEKLRAANQKIADLEVRIQAILE